LARSNVRFDPIDGHDVILGPREARETPLFASEQWCDEDYMTDDELKEQEEQAAKKNPPRWTPVNCYWLASVRADG
jgi:hypothetical protein